MKLTKNNIIIIVIVIAALFFLYYDGGNMIGIGHNEMMNGNYWKRTPGFITIGLVLIIGWLLLRKKK